MAIEFILPQSLGEWLAWLCALGTVLVGLALMFAPRKMLAADDLQLVEGTTAGLSALRGPFGGVYVGFGLVVMMLHPQPLLYLALGGAFVFAVIGRIIALVIDKSWGPTVIAGTIAEIFAAFFPIAYVFGWIV